MYQRDNKFKCWPIKHSKMLTERQISEIRKELESSERPLFLFHDDPDGLTSFLLLYNLIGRGTGMMVKAEPRVDDRFTQKGMDPTHDKIFIADVAMVDQSFIDAVNKPVIWIDHHQPIKRKNVKYYNPRLSDITHNYPASYVCYQVSNRPEDLWIAMTGIVGDWMIPEFADKFAKKYPDLWGKVKKPDDALFETRLGTLVKVFTFILKGPTSDAIKCVRILTRIKDPYEILDQKSPGGKYLYKKYEKINSEYQKVYVEAKKSITKGKFLIYTYRGTQSFSGEMANELLHFYPNKVIIVGRIREGQVRMSLRGSGKNIILPSLQKALNGIDGHGGGHEYACGAAVKVEDFDEFIDNLKKSLN